MSTKYFTIEELREEASKRPITVWTGNTEGGFDNFPRVCIEARLKVNQLNKIYGVHNWTAVFGGDPATEKDDIGKLMKYVQDELDVIVIAVQAKKILDWGGFVDQGWENLKFAHLYDTDYHQDNNKVCWSGRIRCPDGKTTDKIGGQARILFSPLIFNNIVAWFCFGGGAIAASDAEDAYNLGLEVYYIPCKKSSNLLEGGEFGYVHALNEKLKFKYNILDSSNASWKKYSLVALGFGITLYGLKKLSK